VKNIGGFKKGSHLLLVAAAFAAAPLLAASTAYADQVGLGGGVGTITFTSNGNNTIGFSTSGFTGPANFQIPTGTVQDSGNFGLGAMSGGAGPVNGGIFPITSGGTQSFTFTSTTDSDKLTGTVTWPAIKNGTSSPQFDVNALLSILTSSGDAAFVTDFPVGGHASIDFTVSLPGLTLEQVVSSTTGTGSSGNLTTGEVVGAPAPPSSQLPRTEIEIGAVCPPNTGTVCAEHQTVKVRFHWVCPGVQTVGSGFVCPETDFDVVLSINGKLAFAADGTPINSNSPTVPAAPCANGYLIGWVIDQFDRPIKFDGLIGDAVLRGPQLIAGPNAGFSTAVAGYKAVTIQADPALATGALIATVPDPATGAPIVAFDGLPGHYQAVAGTLFGDVKFDRTTAGGGPSPTNALSETWLLLLTLDVRLNLPNNPTFVPLDFFNESLNSVSSTNPNFERLTSTSTEFLCWTQVQLSAINPNLTQVAQGTRKGGVIAGAAEKVPFAGIADTAGATNLIGLVQTIEGTLPNRFFERGYVYSLFHPPPRLSDSDEPGSVIVFPKFTNAAAVSVQ
jgi:hypothetical protein